MNIKYRVLFWRGPGFGKIPKTLTLFFWYFSENSSPSKQHPKYISIVDWKRFHERKIMKITPAVCDLKQIDTYFIPCVNTFMSRTPFNIIYYFYLNKPIFPKFTGDASKSHDTKYTDNFHKDLLIIYKILNFMDNVIHATLLIRAELKSLTLCIFD